MLWYNSRWEILQKYDALLFSILMPFQFFLCLLRYPKSLLIIAQMWDFFFHQIILTLSAQFFYSSKWLPAAERFVFLLLTYARLRLVAKG